MTAQTDEQKLVVLLSDVNHYYRPFCEGPTLHEEMARAILAAGFRRVGPDKVVVPREPTDAMTIAGGESQQQSIGSWGEPKVVWWAMLAAAEGGNG